MSDSSILRNSNNILAPKSCLPARDLKPIIKSEAGLKLSLAFKKPHTKARKRKNSLVATERSTVYEVMDKGNFQSASSAPLKNREGITENMRSHILRKYPSSKVQQLYAKFRHIDFRTLIKFKRNNTIKVLVHESSS